MDTMYPLGQDKKLSLDRKYTVRESLYNRIQTSGIVPEQLNTSLLANSVIFNLLGTAFAAGY
jgi:hypothetical protein